MSERVRNVTKHLLADNWGTLTRYDFQLRMRDGAWQEQRREVYDRGHAAAILLCDPARGTVVLTRQFRMPLYALGEPAWLIEACAGLLDGDDPLSCALREAREETGYVPTRVIHAFDSYMSPGSVTERLSLFIGLYDAQSRQHAGGGLAEEGEDIEVLELPFARAMAMVAEGGITDAKTILLLQHAALSGVFAASPAPQT